MAYRHSSSSGALIIICLAFLVALVQLHPVIVFEEEISTTESNSNDIQQQKCWDKGQLYWPTTDRCHQPAKRGPCEPGKWIILVGDSNSSSNVQCRPIPCPDKQLLLNNGSCHSVDDTSLCPQGKVLASSPFGVADCVCKHGTFPWQQNDADRCYPLYKKGPCPSGQYLYYDSNSSSSSFSTGLECIANICDQDDHIPFDSACYKLGSSEPCSNNAAVTSGYGVSGTQQTLDVDLETLELKCQNVGLSLRQIAIAGYNCGHHSPMRYTSFCRPAWKFG